MKSRRFIDLVTLHAFGGNGGNGCCSFRREKRVPRGGPDGGDGGHGGHVILKADPNEDSLIRIYYAPHQRAQSGTHGKGKQMYGKDGQDLIVPVPCGTTATDKETGALMGEILEPGAELLVARGGKGGKGNCHWTTSTHRAPREHTPGVPGEEITLRLELKLIANAGLVGFPNAGKSSLLARISAAHPRIAAYPFTTLNPIIGAMVGDDFTQITVADIPGLIEGSHAGRGLGHGFLRHIERCSLLIYVIDMAATENRDPVRDYLSLREELRLHNQELVKRPSLVVANKMDLPESEEHMAEFIRKTRKRPVRISALTGQGIDGLKETIRKLWKRQTSGSRPKRGRPPAPTLHEP